MKKTALVLAVAATALSPMMAQADSKLVGSIRYGLTFSDDGTNDEVQIANFGSRIKWNGSTDLGNGTEAISALELRLDGARNGNVVNRHYNVGLKGGFGQVTLGLQDSAYDLVNPDNTWWYGGFGLTGNRSEKEGVIKYTGSFGGATVALAATMWGNNANRDPEREAVDIVDAAVKYSGAGFTVGAGVQSNVGGAAGSDGTAVALHGGYDFGVGSVKLTYGLEDEDFSGAAAEKTGIYTELTFGNFIAFYGQTELDNSASTPTNVGFGYTQSVGPQTTIWYEVHSRDNDDNSDATVEGAATLKYDF